MKPSYLRSRRCCCICAIVSSATPTTIRSEVPPNANGTLMSRPIITGSNAMAVRKMAPGSVIRSTTCSMYSALLLQILGQIDRIEDDGRVEIREQHDQDAHQQDVQPRRRTLRIEVLRNFLRLGVAAELCNRARNDDDRLRKDDRHHTRSVDTERDEVPCRFTLTTACHRALRNLNEHAACCDRDRNDTRHDRDHDHS
jgi:hypothetical protein